VDAHTDADCPADWPWVRNERPLHLDCRSHAGARRREYGEERIALGVDLLAVMRGEGGPDQPVVIGEDLRVRITEVLKYRCGTLDVSKEEGERLRRQRLMLSFGLLLIQPSLRGRRLLMPRAEAAYVAAARRRGGAPAMEPI